MTLFELTRRLLHVYRRPHPAPPPEATIELAHAVLERRRVMQQHAGLVNAICAGPPPGDRIGLMIRDMRGGGDLSRKLNRKRKR